jgi:hypothetical protein
MLHKHPLPTKMLTTGFLAGVGDQMCQQMSNSKTPVLERDWKRTATFVTIGIFY